MRSREIRSAAPSRSYDRPAQLDAGPEEEASTRQARQRECHAASGSRPAPCRFSFDRTACGCAADGNGHAEPAKGCQQVASPASGGEDLRVVCAESRGQTSTSPSPSIAVATGSTASSAQNLDSRRAQLGGVHRMTPGYTSGNRAQSARFTSGSPFPE